MLDTLTALVEKSLVVYDQQHGEARYHLLETVRQYAGDRLAETGGATAYRRRYIDYFLALAEEVELKLSGPDQALWLARLETEHDNLRQVFSFCGEDSESVQKGLRLVGALSLFWLGRNHFKEAQQYCCATLLAWEDSPAPTIERSTVLLLAGNVAYCLGDNQAARQYYEETLTVRRHLGDRRGTIGALGSLGNIAHTQGDYARARSLFEEALALCSEFGLRNWRATTLTCLGNVAFDQEDYAASRAYTEASLEMCRQIGNRDTESITLNNLGRIALRQSVPAEAILFYKQALAIDRERGDSNQEANTLFKLGYAYSASGDAAAAGTAYCQALSLKQEGGDLRTTPAVLEAAAVFMVEQGKGSPEAACRLLGAAERLREDTSTPRSPSEQEICDRALPEILRSLSDQTFSRVRADGRAMTPAEAIAYAIQETEAARAAVAML